jgi:hypothetical protein
LKLEVNNIKVSNKLEKVVALELTASISTIILGIKVKE